MHIKTVTGILGFFITCYFIPDSILEYRKSCMLVSAILAFFAFYWHERSNSTIDKEGGYDVSYIVSWLLFVAFVTVGLISFYDLRKEWPDNDGDGMEYDGRQHP